MKISLGTWRRLQQAATESGTFTVLAADHRGPLRSALQGQAGVPPSDQDLSSLKVDLVRDLAPATSAVLLDHETGARPCIESGALPGRTALLVAMDNGSSDDPALAANTLVEGWSVEHTLAIGASGVKLLVYYHPDCPRAAGTERLVEEVAGQCRDLEMPFYLEPVSYVPESPGKKLSSVELRRVVLESARRLAPLGADILKVEFPVNVKEQPDQADWLDACRELTSVCSVPWVLLSAGVTFDVFLQQTRIACAAGASGVIVGRAVWNEAVSLDQDERRRFLRGTGVDRMQQLLNACRSARSFMEVHVIK